ncbi:hypothetical protein [Phytohabitans rumicis]|uniref:Uncharacterized protein n=1 Tax=Phytohabitans rumicis TaxID=1076125 RepID=A0A6V8LJ80_9ACTN|nr:hypothetical protein [Phytohabitans rumicis]GFJ94981.1 hypothetical protein Prum_086230 [Phytohabitans rumicis]
MVAATQGIVLVVAASGALPYPAALAIVALSLAVLTWSFTRDTVWLWHHREIRSR